MEIIPFIKNLLIDSLAGISYRNLPFIILQFTAAPLALLLGVRILELNEDKGKLVIWCIAFTLLFIIAFTSVPLAIGASFLMLGFLINSKRPSFDGKMSLLFFSFAAASGHLILLLLALVFMFVYSRLIKSKDND